VLTELSIDNWDLLEFAIDDGTLVSLFSLVNLQRFFFCVGTHGMIEETNRLKGGNHLVTLVLTHFIAKGVSGGEFEEKLDAIKAEMRDGFATIQRNSFTTRSLFNDNANLRRGFQY
jgi:hypothetical protein